MGIVDHKHGCMKDTPHRGSCVCECGAIGTNEPGQPRLWHPPVALEDIRDRTKCTCGNGEPCIVHTPLKSIGMSDRGDKLFVPQGTRQFETGATRDADDGKLDFEGFIAPEVLQRYAEYMHKCRLKNIPAGQTIRASDNWQKGIPRKAYMKSLVRHVIEVWREHRAIERTPNVAWPDEEVLCAIMFNAMGYLFEVLREKRERDQRIAGVAKRSDV
jgi:hypothetical protein